MSHAATNWAIQQRGLKPTTKIVLWHLCDRFNPDYGCFPSQERLAHDCEISRATLSLGDLTLQWVRRSRSLAADNWGMGDIALAEELEAYEVDILDGSTVKRTLSTGASSAIYTSAAQIADWGALLGPGDTLTIRIAQLSALIGRGAARTVTLFF